MLIFPSGIHEIKVGFKGKGKLSLSIRIDKLAVETLNKSLSELHDPIITTDFSERTIAGKPESFFWKRSGIFIDFKLIRKPEHDFICGVFSCDADFEQIKTQGEESFFKAGARGSKDNPATIKGLSENVVAYFDSNPSFKRLKY